MAAILVQSPNITFSGSEDRMSVTVFWKFIADWRVRLYLWLRRQALQRVFSDLFLNPGLPKGEPAVGTSHCGIWGTYW